MGTRGSVCTEGAKEMTPAEIAARVASVASSTSEIDYPGIAQDYGALLLARHGRSQSMAERNAERARERREEQARHLREAVELIARPFPDAWDDRDRAKAIRARLRYSGSSYGVDKVPSLCEVLDVLKATAPSTGEG